MKLIFAVCLSLLLVAGCSDPPPPVPASTPLSVEDWKTLPVSEKYDETSFERLKQLDPKLKDEAAWAKFMKEVVIPERRKDIPGEPGQH